MICFTIHLIKGQIKISFCGHRSFKHSDTILKYRRCWTNHHNWEGVWTWIHHVLVPTSEKLLMCWHVHISEGTNIKMCSLYNSIVLRPDQFCSFIILCCSRLQLLRGPLNPIHKITIRQFFISCRFVLQTVLFLKLFSQTSHQCIAIVCTRAGSEFSCVSGMRWSRKLAAWMCRCCRNQNENTWGSFQCLFECMLNSLNSWPFVHQYKNCNPITIQTLNHSFYCTFQLKWGLLYRFIKYCLSKWMLCWR